MTIPILFSLYSSNTHPQDYTQLELPEGTIARIGKGSVGDILYSPDGTCLAVSGSIGTWLYDTATFQEICLLEDSTPIAFSPDATTIATARGYSPEDCAAVRLWDVKTGEHQLTFPLYVEGTDDEDTEDEAVRSIAFSPDATTIVTAEDYITVRLWDAKTGEYQQTLTGHTGTIASIAFSPDGNAIIGVSDTGGLHLWDPKTGEHQQTLTGHTGTIASITFSPDGNTIAIGVFDDVELWDAKTGEHKCTCTQAGHTGFVNVIAFSPDGNIIAGGGEDPRFAAEDTVRLWDAKTGEHKQTLTGHTEAVKSIAFSPDGNTIATGSSDGTVRLWEVNTGKLELTLSGYIEKIHSVALSPDANTIVTRTGDTVRLWEAKTGEQTLTFSVYRKRIDGVLVEDEEPDSVAFSPDGNTIASTGEGGEIHLWEAKTGEYKQTLSVNDLWAVNSLAFSQDGKTLASGSEDGTVLLWKLAD